MSVLAAGTFASIASALVLAWRGKVDTGGAAAALNGPSQWVWGRSAPYRNGLSWRHTALGYGIHHFASLGWAVPYEWVRPRRPVAAAVTTAAVACFVDFKLTPQRLTPGFEKRLTRKSLFLVYAAFAAGLAAGGLLASRK
jgi:hypothetical protein